ncbi:hypothetical protein [Paraburkholderia tropica]|uniref:hypothetical protein n=1 Tax=Paraburkholderia tropica TaxID=92647 RepID=UPI001590FC67|nr:hypothetical protein [Paraburkholderia tropica]
MAAKNRDIKNLAAPSVFDEQAALAALADVKSVDDEKREAFQPCVNFVQKAREKEVSWDKIAKAIVEHGGPKLTGIEVSKFFQEDGRTDPSSRAVRKAKKSKSDSAVKAALAAHSAQSQQKPQGGHA